MDGGERKKKWGCGLLSMAGRSAGLPSVDGKEMETEGVNPSGEETKTVWVKRREVVGVEKLTTDGWRGELTVRGTSQSPEGAAEAVGGRWRGRLSEGGWL
jgi:hypothetical protein